MSDFDGYSFTVITRTNTTFATTDLDVALTDLPAAIDTVLPLGDRRALVLCGTEIGTCTWDGASITFGAFVPLWDAGAMSIPEDSIAVSGDRATLVVPANPEAGGNTQLRFYPIADGVVDVANPQILTLGDEYSDVDIYCYPVGESEFMIYRWPEDTLQRVVVTDGVPAWVEDVIITIPGNASVLVVPGTRTLLLSYYQFEGNRQCIIGVDVDTGVIGEALEETPHPTYRNYRLWPLAGAVALTNATFHPDIAGVSYEIVRPIGLDGLDPFFAGEARVLATFPGAANIVDFIGEGTMIGDYGAARADFAEYDQGEGYHFELSNLNLAAQALGYLDGAGIEILAAMEPASEPSQIWDIEHVIELEPGVIPALAAGYREGRAMFAPV